MLTVFLDYDVVDCTRQNWIDPGWHSECFKNRTLVLVLLMALQLQCVRLAAAPEYVCGLAGYWEWEVMLI